RWSTISSNTSYRIRVQRALSSFPAYELAPDDLAGITFICPTDKSVELFLENQRLPCQVFQLSAQQQIAMVPLRSLDWPLE
ncbi:MAG: hypothetical protein ONB33_02900, partial [candidate division KSB1 bacterium]|nr:hypothetical protein [candidate division KSB1 bacterium]